jgi:hypothetical protein
VDGELDLDITPVVVDEELPLIWSIGRTVPPASPIGDRGGTREAKIADEILSL